MMELNNNQHDNHFDDKVVDKDQQIRSLKSQNKKQVYVIIYLVLIFLSLLIIICVKQFSNNKNNLSDAISEQIDSENNKNTAPTEENAPKNLNPESYGDLSAVNVYKKCSDSVVEIRVEQKLFNIFGENSIGHSQGSGVIIRSNGYIMTNAHVIGNCYLGISVFCDGNQKEAVNAKLIAKDDITDIAVIKIEKEGLKPISFGNSSNLLEGQQVYAIGNPHGLQKSITKGIISALNRYISNDIWSTKYIQIDAAINPGNSGGALFNAAGELIGINTAKLDGNEGIGFAIASNDANKISNDLINKGRVIRPAIGVSINEQLMINGFSDDSELKRFAKIGDTIVSINNKEVKAPIELREELEKHSIGEKISISTKNSYSNIISTSMIELKELKHYR